MVPINKQETSRAYSYSVCRPPLHSLTRIPDQLATRAQVGERTWVETSDIGVENPKLNQRDRFPAPTGA